VLCCVGHKILVVGEQALICMRVAPSKHLQESKIPGLTVHVNACKVCVLICIVLVDIKYLQ